MTLGLASPMTPTEGIINHVGWIADHSERYYGRSILHDSRVVAQNLAGAAVSSVSTDQVFGLRPTPQVI